MSEALLEPLLTSSSGAVFGSETSAPDPENSSHSSGWSMIGVDHEKETPSDDIDSPMTAATRNPDDVPEPLGLSPLTSASTMPSSAGQNWMQIIAMISNFSTSYNAVNISLVLPILEHLVATNAANQSSTDHTSNSTTVGDQSDEAATTTEDKAMVASSLLAGMMVGQVLGGCLGDVACLGGRLGALRLVMLLQVLASIGSTCIVLGNDDDEFYRQLATWRFFLGIGAGGVYPLAAVLSAEQQQSTPSLATPTEPCSLQEQQQKAIHRVVLTFSMQGVGFIAVPIVTVVLLHTLDNLNLVWRLILGLGGLPGIVVAVLQCFHLGRNHGGAGAYQSTFQHEHVDDAGEEVVEVQRGASPNWSVTNSDPTTAESDNGSISDSVSTQSRPQSPDGLFRRSAARSGGDGHEPPGEQGEHEEHPDESGDDAHLSHSFWEAIQHEERIVPKLLGTAGTWFLFDVLFYGNTLFQPVVLETAFGSRQNISSYERIERTALDSLLLTSIALPGYLVAAMVLGRKIGCFNQTPRFVMLQGFALMSILYLGIGVGWHDLREYPILLVLLYGMTFFFANYGPNTTTFVLPSMVFSPSCRSTLNGISAAAGKFGAWVGASLFEPAADSFGDAAVMIICAVAALLAFQLTLVFVRPLAGSHEPI
jgi:MFS transporter, PHS family, inorganic phosphate transporter